MLPSLVAVSCTELNLSTVLVLAWLCLAEYGMCTYIHVNIPIYNYTASVFSVLVASVRHIPNTNLQPPQEKTDQTKVEVKHNC